MTSTAWLDDPNLPCVNCASCYCCYCCEECSLGFVPHSININKSRFEWVSIFPIQCPLMATSSTIMNHVTKQRSQTGFLTMTMTSVNFRGPLSHQIWIQHNTWDAAEQEIGNLNVQLKWICRNNFIESCQRGAEPQRNLSNLLWNQCHKNWGCSGSKGMTYPSISLPFIK